jgi:hypothetical protein
MGVIFMGRKEFDADYVEKLQQNNRKQISGQNILSGVLKEEKGHITLLNVNNIFLVIFWNFFK